MLRFMEYTQYIGHGTLRHDPSRVLPPVDSWLWYKDVLLVQPEFLHQVLMVTLSTLVWAGVTLYRMGRRHGRRS